MATVTKEMLNNFREDFAKLNKAIELKYGVVLKIDNKITFTSDSFNFVVKAYDNENNEDVSVEQLEFNKLCHKYGMKPSDYNRTFEEHGREYKLVGFIPKAKKYSYIGLHSDGKRYKIARVNFI